MTKTAASRRGPRFSWIVFIITLIVVFGLGLLLSSIFERRAESVALLQPVRDIPEFEPRNEVWGENYPREYESYNRTLESDFRSRHGGSAVRDYLEEFPEMVILWAGYSFSKDYNQGRGHAYAVRSSRETLRTGGVESSPMPGTCWTCKSTDVPRLMNEMGADKFYAARWLDLGPEIINPIGCQDCHDPKTMTLRLTRPALLDGLEQRGISPDSLTHNEMRSLVCAQCHAEYYFTKPKISLVFPWANGFSADEMEDYYDERKFSDWPHRLSRARMLKAQHPDYELYRTGVHAARGVSCADCHMPYRVEGGVKYTDHHVRSPLDNIANACQVCHRESEEQLRRDVYDRQDRVLEIRRLAEKALASAHLEAEAARKAGAGKEDLAPIQAGLRSAQWRWDYVAAANSMGFHSPVEALRVLGTALQRAEQARSRLAVLLVRLGAEIPVDLPDVGSKEKAQKYIGWVMEKLREDKQRLLDNLVPEWETAARARRGDTSGED